jgi:hypothetical protein
VNSEPYKLTKPCATCPFRKDIRPFVRPDRVTEIEKTLVHSEFHCHNTIDYSNHDVDDEGDGPFDHGPDATHCAGALILLEKLERPSQMMRIAERLGMYDSSKLDMTAPIYDSFKEMFEAAENEVGRLKAKPKTRRKKR